MDSLKNIMSDIRIFLYGGVRTLPLTIAGAMLILGLMTANYAILFFLVGFLLVTPIAASLINLLIDFSTDAFRVPRSDICDLRILYTTSNSSTALSSVSSMTQFSSLWVAMSAFFFGYLLTNAIELFKRPAIDHTLKITSSAAPDTSNKESNRRSQVMIAIASIVVATFAILSHRIFFSGCESKVGGMLTTGLFGVLGWGWYNALSKTGEDRLSDLFGIANRLLPPSAITNGPIACIPIRK